MFLAKGRIKSQVLTIYDMANESEVRRAKGWMAQDEREVARPDHAETWGYG